MDQLSHKKIFFYLSIVHCLVCHVRYLFIFSAVQQNNTKAMTIVNSHNDWDPLEEIIIGVSDFWCVPNEEPGFKPPQR